MVFRSVEHPELETRLLDVLGEGTLANSPRRTKNAQLLARQQKTFAIAQNLDSLGALTEKRGQFQYHVSNG